jgi:LmbE family N-acetylglucosaminyl deacetylase
MTETSLPDWKRLLVIVAHPDDESFSLGAVLSTFIESGADVSVLCFTRGEASTLHGIEGDLSTIRAKELEAAALELGVSDVHLRDFPDGGLQNIVVPTLLVEAAAIARLKGPDGILAFDTSGVTGRQDHIQATAVATRLATQLGVGLLGWTLPKTVASSLNDEFGTSLAGHEEADLDIAISVNRQKQRRAVERHSSQLAPGSMLWRRLELQSDREYLRWLHHPESLTPNPA